LRLARALFDSLFISGSAREPHLLGWDIRQDSRMAVHRGASLIEPSSTATATMPQYMMRSLLFKHRHRPSASSTQQPPSRRKARWINGQRSGRRPGEGIRAAWSASKVLSREESRSPRPHGHGDRDVANWSISVSSSSSSNIGLACLSGLESTTNRSRQRAALVATRMDWAGGDDQGAAHSSIGPPRPRGHRA
jgi:hypothetical protein